MSNLKMISLSKLGVKIQVKKVFTEKKNVNNYLNA
jgi:hypothetical protein